MRICFAVLLLAIALFLLAEARRPASVALNANSIAADSKFGQKLLSQARRLDDEDRDDEDEDDKDEEEDDEEEEGEEEEENESNEDEDEDEENNNNNNYNYNGDVAWVAGYSLKFQGCHHIKQWNGNADDEEDVRIQTTRLVRFRLCPSSSCSEKKAGGCRNGYGDYIIDMNTYLASYYEAMKDMNENECENHLQYNCDCDDGDGDNGGDEDDDQCEYECFYNAGMYQCIDNDDGDGFDPEDYMECAGLAAGGRRRLEDKDEQNDEQYNYYVGPYCAKQGGEIYLGMFSDDTCTEFADVSFNSITGYDLPYESQSIVDAGCMSCAEMAYGNDDGNGDADGTSEMCEELYTDAGKCESNLPRGVVDEKNTAACNYMAGIKITREDGIVFGGRKRPSPAFTAFIVIFAMAFCAMAFYVWYLRMRLGVQNDSLL